jgi:hypothetical protein
MHRPWLVYRLTGSSFQLGLVVFIVQAPLLFLSPIGELIAERYPRRWVLVAVSSTFRYFVGRIRRESPQVSGEVLKRFLSIFSGAQQIVFDKFTLHVKTRWSDSTFRPQIRM